LTTDRGERLILCQHGNRQIARLEADGRFTARGLEHSSGTPLQFAQRPVLASNGNLYFTNPPYGLDGMNNSPLKELMFNGVYLQRPSARSC
jgi:gluconolactonase